jgi:5-(carboxyamino)imidazole ribonucleotide synthase
MARSKALRGPLAPGSTIGILGSGQLARMLITAASRLGLKCHVYSDTPGPGSDVAAQTTIGTYDDTAALEAFAKSVDVVTFEFENVPEATAKALARHVSVRPNAKAFAVAQDRISEKTFIAKLGIPLAPFSAITSAAQAAKATVSAPSILKTSRLGYDGKGQVSLAPGDDLVAAWTLLGAVPAVLEQRLMFRQEVSVLLVRAQDGVTAIYDVPQNSHSGGILRRSIVPAPLDEACVYRAEALAEQIAAALDYIGVLAVEMFDLGPDVALEDRFVVNEIAPRVHNSGHWTLDACAVSQFENHIRAVADWPLGSTERHSAAEMQNLIGQEAVAWRDIAAEPGACLHLYGKRDAREGRKMGHVTRLLPRGTRG